MSVDVEGWYARYGPMVLRRCRALLRNEDDALDAMQDTFVAVMRRAESLVDDAPSSLLYRTATNLCLNKIRHRKRHPEDGRETLLAQIATFDDAEGRGWSSAVLERIFRREPPSTRAIAVMHLVDGMTHAEVAKAVGLSVSGVRKRLRTLQEKIQTDRPDRIPDQ